jgi:acid phosphatase
MSRRFLFSCTAALCLAAAITAPFSSVKADEPAQANTNAGSIAWPQGLPRYDHIVIVFEENKDYEQIIGNAWTPYINSVLCKEGAVFTQMYGEEHFSEGNYFWLLSGNNHAMGFLDAMPKQPLEASNVAQQLIAKGLSFKGYSENLPAVGSDVVVYPPKPERALYARKHVPWVSFKNIPAACNVPFTDFPKDAEGFKALPTLSIVIPNLINDMHDGKPSDSVPAGDRWLKENLDAYYQWAKANNSLLVITFDENDDRTRYKGLTNPLIEVGTGPDQQFRHDAKNQIPTVFAGAHIKPGEYPEDKGITHVNILRTLEAMYGLPRSGSQQGNALGAGIADDYIITDVFD